MTLLDDYHLKKYIEGFLGYGNLDSRTWYIGMEEGGGHDVADVNARLKAWSTRGCNLVEDFVDFHNACGFPQASQIKPAKLSKTWSRLIRIKLSRRGEKNPSTEIVRQIQAENWGRISGEECLLELMPLPSPRVNDWSYSTWSQLDFLRTRARYLSHIEPVRTALISELLRKHRPQCVVFYGSSYQRFWDKITGDEVNWQQVDTARWFRRETTTFFSISHPTARDSTNRWFSSIGTEIEKIVTSS